MNEIKKCGSGGETWGVEFGERCSWNVDQARIEMSELCLISLGCPVNLDC